MGLSITDEKLNGLILFDTKVFGDDRGFFMESYRADEFEKYGLPTDFVQDNHSGSVKNTLRGMHFQWDKPQGKLIRVTSGEALIVEIDIRKNSPTIGKFEQFNLSSDNKRVLWVPPGFANGFLVLSEWCEVQYKCTSIYNPKAESGIRWNDPELGIDWPCDDPIVSGKDAEAQTLAEWLEREDSENFNM